MPRVPATQTPVAKWFFLPEYGVVKRHLYRLTLRQISYFRDPVAAEHLRFLVRDRFQRFDGGISSGDKVIGSKLSASHYRKHLTDGHALYTNLLRANNDDAECARRVLRLAYGRVGVRSAPHSAGKPRSYCGHSPCTTKPSPAPGPHWRRPLASPSREQKPGDQDRAST